jgi:hypothetical protein
VVTIQFAARAAVVVVVGAAAAPACSQERKQECDKLLTAMRVLDQGPPTPESVGHVRRDIEALNLQDQPLHIYATNYGQTLTVLEATLRLKEDPAAPDGTDDVIKTRLKEARTDSGDVARYCAE